MLQEPLSIYYQINLFTTTTASPGAAISRYSKAVASAILIFRLIESYLHHISCIRQTPARVSVGYKKLQFIIRRTDLTIA